MLSRRDLRRLLARQSTVPSESGSKAMITRASPMPAAKRSYQWRVRRSSAGPPARVGRAAAVADVAHHAHQRHRAGLHGGGAVEVVAHLLGHVRARPAAEPAELRLARDLPHQRGLEAVAAVEVLGVGLVGVLERVDVPAQAAQRVRVGRARALRADTPARPGPPARARSCAAPRGSGPGRAPAAGRARDRSSAAPDRPGPRPDRRPAAPAAGSARAPERRARGWPGAS